MPVENKDKGKEKREKEEKRTPEYLPPEVTTYTSEEILEQIGPAQACSPSPCAIGP